MNSEKALNNNDLRLFGPFRLDVAERRLYKEGKAVNLRAKAFDLLLILVEAAGHLKSREELIQALWPDTIVEEHGLTVSMSALRKALGGESEAAQYIETVRGHGYRFIAPVAIEKKPAAAETAELRAPHTSIRHPIWISIGGALLTIIIVLAGLFIWHNFTGTRVSGPARLHAHSIAVLPFENLSADKSNAYFAAGIQDTILTKLAGIGSLKVISRTSTEHYPSHPGKLRQIARQLGVATVLEGSVQKAGNQVLINVQLIDAHDGRHIWAQTYTRTLGNVFDVEGDVAREVASALKTKLLPAEAARVARAPTQDPQAYDAFLRAEYLARQVERGTTKDPKAIAPQAVRLYRKAIEQDPHFSLADAKLSLLESHMYWYGLDRTPARLQSAEQAAQRALSLAPNLPEAHLAMGYVFYWGHRNYSAALREFESLRHSLPNDPDIAGALASIKRREGKWDEALKNFRRAAILDPLNPRWSDEVGLTLSQLRRYAEAQEAFDRSFSVAPKDYFALLWEVSSQILAGQLAQASHTLSKVPSDIKPENAVLAFRFKLAWLDRDSKHALDILAPVSATWIGALFQVGNVPVSLLSAQAWALQDNKTQSYRGYQTARQILDKTLQKQPNNPNLLSFLGLTEAGLGYKREAISAAQRSTKLLPVARDAIDGPSHLVTLAAVYAQVGEPKKSIKLLRYLLNIPAGLSISVPLLRLDPIWDPIRHDSAFQKLLRQYETASSTTTVGQPQ